MRRALALLCAAVFLAGCGGTAKKGVQPDPGRQVLTAFIGAAGRGDAAAMRRLLSEQSSRRMGPEALKRLAAVLRPLAVGNRLVVSERITNDFGLAAVAGRTSAYGAALRRVGSGWKLELAGPVRIMPLGPGPGVREPRVRQLAAAIEGGSGSGDALLYLDGVVVPGSKVYSFRSKLSVVANLPMAVPAGRHSIVVFATRRAEASALAWTFSVPR